MSFQHPDRGYVINIIDEANITQLRNVMSETKKIVHLYLEVDEGQVEEALLEDNFVLDNVDNIVSYKFEECSGEEIMAVNEMEEQNLYEFGRVSEKTLSDDEKSNEGWIEVEFAHVKKNLQTYFTICLLRPKNTK